MRIVADTNVIVSALIFGGIPQRVLDLAAAGIVVLCYSAPIQEEVERVLEQKFGWKSNDGHQRVRSLLSWGIRVHPEVSLAVIKDDPDDDRILECAVAARAQAIVSGDRHLLRLTSFQGIQIQTPRQFLDSIAWATTE